MLALDEILSDVVCRELWEQKPLLVRRHQPQYYNLVFSTRELDRILREVLEISDDGIRKFSVCVGLFAGKC